MVDGLKVVLLKHWIFLLAWTLQMKSVGDRVFVGFSSSSA